MTNKEYQALAKAAREERALQYQAEMQRVLLRDEYHRKATADKNPIPIDEPD